jgi:hypothetical protein
VLDVVGEGEPDRVGEPAAWSAQPGEELVGAAAGVGADQHLMTTVAGQLSQGEAGGGDVVVRGVGAGVSRPQHDGQWLAGAAFSVIGEDCHRVEAEGFLPGRSCLLLVGVGYEDGGVDVEGDQFAVGAGCGGSGQHPGACSCGGAGSANSFQCPC